jgi:site-specific DNA recombinase
MTTEYYLIYTRVSTDGQTAEAQEAEVRRFCASHNLEILEVRHEEAISAGGLVEMRPVLSRIYEELRDKNRAWAGVIVWKIDRVFRNQSEELHGWNLFDKHKAKLLSVTEHVDRTSAAGRLNTGIMATMRQYEREVIAERVILHSRYKAQLGQLPSGRPPLGYTYDPTDKTISVDPDKAMHALAVFETYVATNGNRHDTARRLNVSGIPTRTGRLWHAQTVYTLVKSPYYRGIIKYQDVETPDALPVFIPEDLLRSADLLLEGKRTRRQRSTQQKRSYSGILSCGECGSRLYQSGRSKYPGSLMWSCHTRTKHGLCSARGIGNTRLDRLVMRGMEQAFTYEREQFLAVPVQEEAKVTGELLDGRLQALRNRRAKLIDLHLADMLSKDDLSHRLKEIDEEIGRISSMERPKETIPAELFPHVLDDFLSFWVNLSEESKNKLLTLACPHITVHSGAPGTAWVELHTNLLIGTLTVSEDAQEAGYTTVDVARVLGISENSVVEWEAKGWIPQAIRIEANNSQRVWSEEQFREIERTDRKKRH